MKMMLRKRLLIEPVLLEMGALFGSCSMLNDNFIVNFIDPENNRRPESRLSSFLTFSNSKIAKGEIGRSNTGLTGSSRIVRLLKL
jgi:hypothetical protein